jgi:hypothetical protein
MNLTGGAERSNPVSLIPVHARFFRLMRLAGLDCG